jgi:hypothetical protein
MRPDQARGVDADAPRFVATQIDIANVERDADLTDSEGSDSLDFLNFVEIVIEQTWRRADADFGVCVNLRGR